MVTINENYLKLKAGYLFPEISRRVSAFAVANPEAKIIRMGIGDVTRPLTPAILKAFHAAVDEMGTESNFKGYGPEQGYGFLREKIAKFDFQDRGCNIDADEIFVSDGSKCDTGNIQEIFGKDSIIAVSDPVYPVYVDTTVMAGKTGSCNEKGYFENIVYMPCSAENNFLPSFPSKRADLIFLCYPNNPTGMTASKAELTKWVKYAKENGSIILFDAAYEAFIQDPSIPHSIYEIEGAKEVAIEFRSFSKTAGFTGTRCAFTVIPKELKAASSQGPISLNSLWNRRQSTKFNGVSYPVQRAAEAIYSPEGQKEVKETIAFYLENASILKKALQEQGFTVFGGDNAPYVWVKTKNNLDSWSFFDLLLSKLNIVGTPGSGFGPSGEGYFRFSSFAGRAAVLEAIERIKKASL